MTLRCSFLAVHVSAACLWESKCASTSTVIRVMGIREHQGRGMTRPHLLSYSSEIFSRSFKICQASGSCSTAIIFMHGGIALPTTLNDSCLLWKTGIRGEARLHYMPHCCIQCKRCFANGEGFAPRKNTSSLASWWHIHRHPIGPCERRANTRI